jgi:DNA-binding NarL/FixJ family response regulator
VAIIRKPERGDPVGQRLFDALHELHLQAGAPSVRTVQERIGTVSRDTVHRVLAGPKIPPWPAVESVVRALSGDPNRFRALWIAAQRPPDPAPVPEVPQVEPVAEPIRVLVVDDHPLYRQALTTVLHSGGCAVVGTAEDGARGVAMAVELLPDVVLMDLRMPVLNGIEATAEIHRQQPAVRILALTAQDDREEALRVFGAGATGFLTKSAEAQEILDAVRTVHEGGTYVGERFRTAGARTQPATLLSTRERQVLALMMEGMTDAEAAERLGVSIRTARRLIADIMHKTGVHGRAALGAYAATHGLLRGSE